jgi:hypothetical protein
MSECETILANIRLEGVARWLGSGGYRKLLRHSDANCLF